MHDHGFVASDYVEPDRVRREIYIDPQLFELEMERIHEQIWIYCGHATQVPHSGDYCTFQLGRQPMVMIRRADGEVSVLYNRCPHRGAMICGNHQGNMGKFFKCSYHAWSFRHDGSLAVRMKRVLHPEAWSQVPIWETNHIVGNVVIQDITAEGDVVVRSRFQMIELRREDVRHFAGRYLHVLKKHQDNGYLIEKQRVDMFNAQATYDFVLQVWV